MESKSNRRDSEEVLLWTILMALTVWGIIATLLTLRSDGLRRVPTAPQCRAAGGAPMAWRMVQLLVGLWLYGATMAMMVRAGLGLDPWDVFHEGLTHHIPLTFGQVVIVVGAVVLLAWIPLRQMPGIGTVLNVVVIGVAADATLAVLPDAQNLWVGVVLLVGGIVGNGVAGAMYVGAGLGTGPRDGLWTGIVRRTGASVRRVRTSLEIGVLVAGFLLGGTVGLGTVLYALAIGPLVQMFLPWFEVRRAAVAEPTAA